MTYPDQWPKPNARTWTLVSRITDQDKLDLYNKVTTVKALAKKYNTNASYLASLFPGRHITPRVRKKDLLLAKTREEFRFEVCKRVLRGEITIGKASEICSCSYNTMQRWVKTAKTKFPDLAVEHNERVAEYRKNFNRGNHVNTPA